jgi:predicted transcriptional regulator
VITDDLYAALKKQLKKAKEPVTCNDLMDSHDVRQLDDVTNEDVSNALAALWRRGMLERFNVHRGHGRGPRYSYSIRQGKSVDTQHMPADKAVNLDKLEVKQTDDGAVVFTTDRLIITVRPAAK